MLCAGLCGAVPGLVAADVDVLSGIVLWSCAPSVELVCVESFIVVQFV